MMKMTQPLLSFLQGYFARGGRALPSGAQGNPRPFPVILSLVLLRSSGAGGHHAVLGIKPRASRYEACSLSL